MFCVLSSMRNTFESFLWTVKDVSEPDRMNTTWTRIQILEGPEETLIAEMGDYNAAHKIVDEHNSTVRVLTMHER